MGEFSTTCGSLHAELHCNVFVIFQSLSRVCSQVHGSLSPNSFQTQSAEVAGAWGWSRAPSVAGFVHDSWISTNMLGLALHGAITSAPNKLHIWAEVLILRHISGH